MDIPTTVMKSLKRNYHFLHVLSKSSPTQRKALLRTANKDQILSLCEVCLNVLAGNIPIQKKNLYKYRHAIRKLVSRSTNVMKKKRLLTNQTGGFLPLILRAVVPALSSILGQVLGNNLK